MTNKFKTNEEYRILDSKTAEKLGLTLSVVSLIRHFFWSEKLDRKGMEEKLAARLMLNKKEKSPENKLWRETFDYLFNYCKPEDYDYIIRRYD